MTLAGERHIELARQAHAHRTTGLPRAECGDSGPGIGLDFLAAKGAAHPDALDGHVLPGQAEHARDDLLRLRRMLRRRLGNDAARLVDPCDGGLRLQVEVLLPADRQLALY